MIRQILLWTLIAFFVIVMTSPSVFADFVPSGDIDGRGVYAIKNFTNITGGELCLNNSNPDCIDDWSSVNYTYNAGGNYLYLSDFTFLFNESKLNETIDNLDDDTTYTAGDGLVLSSYEFSHNDTSTMSSSMNSGRTYIQSVGLDDYGHVTSLTTATETVTNTDNQTLAVDSTNIDDEITISDGNTITIDDDDTTYTAGSNLTLTDTEFDWDSTWSENTFIKQSLESDLNVNDSDFLDGQDGSYYLDNTDSQDLSSSRSGDTVTIDITGGSGTSFTDNYEADTNADTECSGADTYLSGDGTCEVDSDTTYTAGGTLLDLTGETFSLNEGTLTDTKYCTYESGTGIVCDSEGGSGGEGGNTTEEIQDAVYNNVLSGTQTFITVTYDDANDEVDYVVDDNWYDSIGDLPTDTISDGDTSHIANNNQIYDFVTGQGYLTSSPFGSSINDDEMASESFGEFTCDGTEDGCTLNTGVYDDEYVELDDSFSGEVTGTYDNTEVSNNALDDQYVEQDGSDSDLDMNNNNVTAVECINFENGASWCGAS